MPDTQDKAIARVGEPPTSSCLVICEDVIRSSVRGSHTLVTVINGLSATHFPDTAGPFVAYIRLANVYPNQNLLLKFTNAATDEELFKFIAMSPQESDPLGNHTLILRIPAFEIPAAGRYVFSAVHNGVPFATSVIEVKGPESEDTGE